MSWWKRLWVSGYDRLNAAADRSWQGAVREQLVSQATGRVLEIGGGTGANLPYYRAIDELVITEPDAEMRRRLAPRLADATIPATLEAASAERLPFDDNSFDTAVSTLVLCSVADPEQAAREIRRVLKPGGRFLFLEHGGATGKRGIWQQRLDPVWTHLAAGCHLTRSAPHLLEDAGFRVETTQRFEPRQAPGIIKPFTMGVATA